MPLYRWLMRRCPEPLRREYGAAMEETYARRMHDARGLDLRRRAQLWWRELAGLAALVIAERWGAAERSRRRRRYITIQRIEPERTREPMRLLAREIRHAARRLVWSPAFTLATVLTLGLAIGATSAIFTVVQRVVINPLPYPDSDRLIDPDHGARGLNLTSGLAMTTGLYHQYADRARTLEGIALYRVEEQTLAGHGVPERIRTAYVTPSLASVLRVWPVHGRWFTTAEGLPGGASPAVLSHGLWMRRYGGDSAIIGRAVNVNGVAAEVVGVMPPSLAYPDPFVDMWLPEQSTRAAGFGIFDRRGVARMREGVTLDAVRADLNTLIADLPHAYPEYPKTIGYNLNMISAAVPLKETIVGPVSRLLWMLLASSGLLLLVACANVANLFLVRTEARQREVAVRRALGAGGSGIARYFLGESLLLALAGGALGLAISSAAVRLLARFGPSNLPRLEELRMDGVSLAFTAALTMAAALAFGVMPLLRGAPLSALLHESGRGQTASRRRHRVRRVLMGAQVAVALVLLVFSGLMVRSFQRLRAIDPGFDASSALTFRIGLPARDYPDRRAAVAAHHAILDRLAALPGVTAVSASTCLPLSDEGTCYNNVLMVEGRPLPKNALPPIAAFQAVAGGYVQAMGMRLLRGRSLERADVDRSEPAVMINEALANVFFPNQDPIGARISASSPTPTPWMTIVGIVSNTPAMALAERRPMPTLYMPMSTAGGPGIPVSALLGPDVSIMNFVLRTATPPRGLAPSVRRVMGDVDPNLAIARVRTLQDIFDRASALMAFTMALLALAAGVALMLGMIGIYGVTAYIVAQRTGEIGLRLALGAEPRSVARMIVQQGGLVALAGITVGLAAAFAGGRLIESLLYDVSPRDPGVFAAATLTLLGVAVLACWLPARRAARLSPVDALRAE